MNKRSLLSELINIGLDADMAERIVKADLIEPEEIEPEDMDEEFIENIIQLLAEIEGPKQC